jgi:mannose-6-phosphate isomerase
MRRVEGVIQRYAWGDPSFLPELLGLTPDGTPWAELWLGTHPNGPTQLDGAPLAETTGDLPYLLKVLAAAAPLSLQTHPDRARAESGFAQGIYPDPNPKPELLCALTPFEALCGVRPVAATRSLLLELGLVELADRIDVEGPGRVVTELVRGELDPRPIIDACATAAPPEAAWVRRLDALYPGDPSVAVALLLNHVVLAPGEALRLDAGNVHAYLHGAGIELMGASDNVVRAGLTVKPVDVDELLRVADLTPLDEPVLPLADRYELPGAGVALVRLEPGRRHVSTGHELGVDLAGGTWYLAPGHACDVTVESYVVVPI